MEGYIMVWSVTDSTMYVVPMTYFQKFWSECYKILRNIETYFPCSCHVVVSESWQQGRFYDNYPPPIQWGMGLYPHSDNTVNTCNTMLMIPQYRLQYRYPSFYSTILSVHCHFGSCSWFNNYYWYEEIFLDILRLEETFL